MIEYVFCPKCGSTLKSAVIGDEGEVPFCEQCKLPYFKQFPTCVIIAVINEGNKVILLRQKYVSEANHVLVAGYIKCGDNAEETVAKEVQEETGQNIFKMKYLRSYFYDNKRMLMLGYIAYVNATDFAKSIEVDDIGWFDFDTALQLVRSGSIAEKHLISVIREVNED